MRLGDEHRALAAGVLVLLAVLLVEPILFRSHLLVPTTQRVELQEGLSSPEYGDDEQPFLADINRYFIPELALHFRGNPTGWISLWNPLVQLGRPTYHFEGFSKAHPVLFVLSLFGDDPARLHAQLAVVILLLFVAVSYCFLCELGLHPLAALVATVGIALNSRNAYWLGFPQFLAWPACSLAVMWVATKLAKKATVHWWFALVFACYCLAVGTRSQAVIKVAYLVVPFLVWCMFRYRECWRDRVRYGVVLGSAGAVALVLSLPVLMTLYQGVAESTRFDSDTTGWILEVPHDPVASFARLWNDFIHGNPLRQAKDSVTSALNLSPLLMAFVGSGLVMKRVVRRGALFLAVAAVFAAMGSSPWIHWFAVEYCGFRFSKSNPLGGVYLPVLIFCGYAIDELIRRRPEGWNQRLVPFLAASLVTAAGVTATVVTVPAGELSWRYLWLGLALAGVALAFVWTRWRVLLLVGAVGYVVVFSCPALLHRPASQVVTETELTRTLARETAPAYRYAKLSNVRTVIPSNMEASLGLRSIHSYDPISSMRYQALASRLNERGTQIFGRHFDGLDRLDRSRVDELSYAGVIAVLSRNRHAVAGWEPRRLGDDLWILVREQPPLLVARLQDHNVSVTSPVLLKGPLEDHAMPGAATLTGMFDDRWEVDLRPFAKASLLFLSTQYHSGWKAFADGEPATTVLVNDFYLGVRVPAGATRVVTQYVSVGSWTWVPLLIFGLGFAALAALRVAAVVRGPGAEAFGGRVSGLWGGSRRRDDPPG